MSDPITAFFVYGTLKQGECRETSWPYPPTSVTAATTQGRLYDLGPYPALVRGEDTVVGELWTVTPEHLKSTLRVLDRIEGYRPDASTNLYEREVVECRPDDGAIHHAWTYFYSQELPADGEGWLNPDSRGRVSWSS